MQADFCSLAGVRSQKIIVDWQEIASLDMPPEEAYTLSPCPSCPYLLHPNVKIFPLLSTATLCRHPQATLTILFCVKPGTRVGTHLQCSMVSITGARPFWEDVLHRELAFSNIVMEWFCNIALEQWCNLSAMLIAGSNSKGASCTVVHVARISALRASLQMCRRKRYSRLHYLLYAQMRDLSAFSPSPKFP